MPITGKGDDRYPMRPQAMRPRMIHDGIDLGTAMTPCDVYIELRALLFLEDDELIEAFRIGAADIMEADAGPGSALVLHVGNRDAVCHAALAVTRSRLVAWRRRAREMTWPELRVLMLGLRSVVRNQAGRPEREAGADE